MSWESSLKIAAVNAENFLEKLLAEIEGTPAVQAAEVAGIETLKGVIEVALAPYLGIFDPEANAALDSFAKLIESKIVPAAVSAKAK